MKKPYSMKSSLLLNNSKSFITSFSFIGYPGIDTIIHSEKLNTPFSAGAMLPVIIGEGIFGLSFTVLSYSRTALALFSAV